MARYNKQAGIRDGQAADWMMRQHDYYSEHSDKHLRNALTFAKGCSGAEARARAEMIRREMRKRGNEFA